MLAVVRPEGEFALDCGCRLALERRLREMSLKSTAWLSLIGLAVVMGLLLFVCAGTLRYWRAMYLLVFFGLSVAITADLLRPAGSL